MPFRDIIGHRELIESLIRAVSAGRIPHAQLFWGPEGNQKLALALAYAQYINCTHKLHAGQTDTDLHGLSSDSCGQCPSCIKFQKLVHPDLHFVYPNNINGSSVTKDSQSLDYIEQWRNLMLASGAEFSYNEWVETMGIGNRQAIINIRDCGQIMQTLSLKPSEAPYRIMLVWMIEKLSDTIASTLLKTLEEPEPQTVFLLVSENSDQILPTILSRTQMVKVGRLEKEDIEQYVLQQLPGTNEDERRQKAGQTALAASGNLLAARELLSQSEQRASFHESFAGWMRHCFKVDMPALVNLSDSFAAMGRENLKFFFKHCLNEYRGALLTGCGCTAPLHASDAEQSFWNNFSKFVTQENIEQYYKLFDEGIHGISRNAHIPTLITDMSLELCRILAAAQARLKK